MSIKVLDLPSDFNLGVLVIWHIDVTTMIEAKQDFVFDGSHVQRVDAAAVQFLIQIQRLHTGVTSVLVNASDPLKHALNTLGLDLSLKSVSELQAPQVKG